MNPSAAVRPNRQLRSDAHTHQGTMGRGKRRAYTSGGDGEGMVFHPPRTSLGFADLILGAPPRKPTHTATGPVSPAMCATGLADERLESGAEVGPGYLGVATFDGTVQARFDVVGEDDLRCGIEGSAHGRDLSQDHRLPIERKAEA